MSFSAFKNNLFKKYKTNTSQLLTSKYNYKAINYDDVLLFNNIDDIKNEIKKYDDKEAKLKYITFDPLNKFVNELLINHKISIPCLKSKDSNIISLPFKINKTNISISQF
ncbi:MAG: hypothetical protein AAB390_04985 [Patescibacteria group bacterium]